MTTLGRQRNLGRWAIAALAIAAIVLGSDPRLSALAEHSHDGEVSAPLDCCCGTTTRIGAEAILPADVACECCAPAPQAPPIEPDARGSAVNAEDVAAPAHVATITPQDLPRPVSTPPPPFAASLASEPPIFLRTCRFLC